MKKILVIGSAVVDIIINVDHLPGKEEDVHTISQRLSLGGCAYNTSDIIRHFRVPYIPFFPVGTGIYGDFVRAELANKGIVSPIPTPDKDNGCCYCLVEADGERTFISHHGAEYQFRREWFDALDASEISSVYICGLEIEEPTGPNIVDYLETHPEYAVFFAPGPRLGRIDPTLMKRIFALHPILHLNEEEARTYCASLRQPVSQPEGQSVVSNGEPKLPAKTEKLLLQETAGDANRLQNLNLYARTLLALTGSPVMITLGADGCCLYDGSDDSGQIIPGVPAKQIDTIGAGDSHIGAVIANLQLGKSLPEAIAIANRISALVVETPGALLSDEEFENHSSRFSLF